MKVQFASGKRHAPDMDNGLKVNYAPGKRAVSKATWYVIVAIVCSPLFYFLYTVVETTLLVSAPGYITLEQYELNSAGRGRIEKLLVRPGDELAKGDVVAQLVDVELQADIVRLKNEIRALESTPERDTGYLAERYDLAEREYHYHQRALEKIEYLFDRGAATVAEVNNAQSTVRRAEITLVEAREAMASASLPPALSPRAAASLDTARANLLAKQARLADLVQVAPQEGRVLDSFVQENQFVDMGDTMLLLGALSTVKATAYIDPKDARYAEIGQEAEVQFPSGKRMNATITELPELTQRLPAEFVGPLGLRRLKILARLEFDSPLPEGSKVDGLPLTIHFPFKL